MNRLLVENQKLGINLHTSENTFQVLGLIKLFGVINLENILTVVAIKLNELESIKKTYILMVTDGVAITFKLGR